MRSAFDIIGPIMIGPSSSHTAGAVRLGLMAKEILVEPVKSVEIKLHGSFAQTYKGHGTDRALIAGIMGFKPDDERIRDALQIATENNIKYSFEKVNLDDAHPNTAIIKLTGISGHVVSVQGASIGGGNIVISYINDFEVNLSGKYPSLIVVHKDRPGVINGVTAALALYNINIAYMKVSRKERGAQALMNIEVDNAVSDEAIGVCSTLPGVEKVLRIDAI
ncbi:L-serine ammonia-lyase, iron-sulfur-dependent, subunit beta [Megamonas hypermegale]|uniref:L-serine ammonia-lyase, iron-sulfur-dependent subunit beta n=1 Tax=Megamonas hypermegale TaxID=158847 RepID=UPI000B39C582|nr:L-serine ammonia-lyase, iron-sulfur-dependent subunit beta [Megamonas hypermegale]OUO38814.1 L-serine ammonia-lyase, iron-sulfur-dependent, subunit beta [Megamonas hypermegale]